MDDPHLLRSLRAFAEHRVGCPARPSDQPEDECECGVISVLIASNVVLGLPLDHRPKQLARYIHSSTRAGDDPRRHTRGT